MLNHLQGFGALDFRVREQVEILAEMTRALGGLRVVKLRMPDAGRVRREFLAVLRARAVDAGDPTMYAGLTVAQWDPEGIAVEKERKRVQEGLRGLH